MKSPSSVMLAITACLLWSTAFLGVKTGLQFLSPLVFAGIRFTLAGIAVGLISRKKEYFSQVRTHWRSVILIGFFQTFGLYAFFYLSLNAMRASTGAILNGLGPLATALSAHFFLPGDRLNRRRLFSMLLGVLSAALITLSGQKGGGGAGNETFGIILMGFSLLSNAAAMVLVARSSDDMDPFILNSAQLTLGGLLLLFSGLIFEGVPAVMPPWYFFPALIWLVGVTSGGFSIWYYLLKIRKEPVSHITVWKFLIPVAGPVLSWIFIGNDKPGILSLAGMTLTAFSIMLFYSKGPLGKILKKERA